MLGASAGLGGLVLVFLGLVIAGYQGVPADAPRTVKARAKRAGLPTVAVFGLSLANVGVNLAWLAAPGGDCLYRIAIWAFVAELLALFGLAAYVAGSQLN